MPLSSPESVKYVLDSTLTSLFKNRKKFLLHPDSDFSRTKRISFQQTMIFPMIASSGNIHTELLDFFGEESLPSASAMIQRREKIDPSAFLELFYQFTSHFPVRKRFRGYRLLACDGSRLNLPYNSSDSDTFIQCIEGRKGINQIHLNSLYDILNDTFVDVELQSVHKMNEKAAFLTLLQRQDQGKNIFIADRGYASFNNFAYCIHNNQLFLIRIPESFAKSLCPSDTKWLEKDLEDADLTLHIGRSKKKQYFQLENYHHIPRGRHYDFLPAGSDMVDCLKLRIIKFPLSEGSFGYMATNLPAYGFSTKTLIELYHRRWGIETAFRHLKYAGNMVHIHSLKKEFLLQEIYAKLTMYNYSSFTAASVEEVINPKTAPKYEYRINHTQLQKTCIRFLRGSVKKIAELISKMMVPVRPGRKFDRNLRRQSADTLAYR